MKSQDTPGARTARDREMGRDSEPQGDLGKRGKTWTPPDGSQGISNRPGDQAPTAKGIKDEEGSSTDGDDAEGDEVMFAEPEEQDSGTERSDYVAGGDKSNRAAVSGATGERHPGGGANKPEPKDQDLKGNARPRNNTDRDR